MVILEKHVQAKIIRYLKKRFPKAIVWKLTEETNCGIPDIIFLWSGMTIFFEVKRPGGTLRPLQKVVLKKIRDQNIHATVVHSVEEVQDYLALNILDFKP